MAETAGADADPVKLVFGKEAAQALNVSDWYMASMKRAGAPFWCRKTDIEELEKWLRANPRFSAQSQWPKYGQRRRPVRRPTV